MTDGLGLVTLRQVSESIGIAPPATSDCRGVVQCLLLSLQRIHGRGEIFKNLPDGPLSRISGRLRNGFQEVTAGEARQLRTRTRLASLFG